MACVTSFNCLWTTAGGDFGCGENTAPASGDNISGDIWCSDSSCTGEADSTATVGCQDISGSPAPLCSCASTNSVDLWTASATYSDASCQNVCSGTPELPFSAAGILIFFAIIVFSFRKRTVLLRGLTTLCLLFGFGVSAVAVETPTFPKTQLRLNNFGYLYNDENNAWGNTQGTITYFENLFQPTLSIEASEMLQFQAGVGLLVPFNQEQKILSYYPFIQTKIITEDVTLEVGSLDGNHDFPAPILDPILTLIPQKRLNTTNGGLDIVPINYETYPLGRFSHGRYEYGFSLKWPKGSGRGELYLNWQLQDSVNHRERFDAGLIHSCRNSAVPLYGALHYWHNGGHENPHPVEVTENYVAALGLRTDTYSALYLASYFIPDRSIQTNTFGQAFYLEMNFKFGSWVFQPSLFISDEMRVGSHRYISIEGDPFFRVPAYIGLNFSKTFSLWKSSELKLAFVNGLFWTAPGTTIKGRYDQLLRADFKYEFDL